MFSRPASLLALSLLSLGLLPGCRPAEPEPNPHAALIGTWEITGEAGTLNRNGQRYYFGDDGTLQITRPRPLGPMTTINAAYDFDTDSTIQIRSEFDAETLIPVFQGDTLLLRPLGTGDPMTLVRIPDAAPPPTPAPVSTPPALQDSIYSPPSDAPLDELPPARSQEQPPPS